MLGTNKTVTVANVLFSLILKSFPTFMLYLSLFLDSINYFLGKGVKYDVIWNPYQRDFLLPIEINYIAL